ncbi:LAFA_0G15632g1_1 [Lachancea sp. 'fantastica']|nr:LAFA_0G15632g1_1 [Lachancea sp. 'fantastica']
MSASIVEQYQNSEDNDLRYMALREHFLHIQDPMDDQMLLDTTSRVLIPALNDRDRAISELVSTQILPHIAEINVLEAEMCVILPLCENLLETTSHVHSSPPVLQALKNVLSRSNSPLQTSKPLERFCETLALLRIRPYMVWDTLSLLLERTPVTLSAHVIQSQYSTLYRLALSDGGSAAMIALRTATGKVSAETVLSTFEENREFTDVHLKLLSYITSEQVAFRLLYPELIDKLLQVQLTEYACKTLVNLSVWLQQPAMSESSNLKTELQHRLFAKCYDVLADYAEKMETDSENEEDSEQEAYFKELSADGYGEGVMFEDEGKDEAYQSSSELPPTVDSWLKLLQQIKLRLPQTIVSILASPKFAKVRDCFPVQDGRSGDETVSRKIDEITNEGNLQLGVEPDLISSGAPNLPTDADLTEKISNFSEALNITEAPKETGIRWLYSMLSTDESNLADLEMAVDAASALSRREDMQDMHDFIAELLWPHLKPNKLFIGTVKVGNMKQSIDDGVSFRINCYALIQQLQLSYGSQCRTLEECVERGFKDEAEIKEVSAALFNSIFTQIWPEIEIRDACWLRDKLWTRIQDRLNKALATKPNDSSTSHQISNWTRGIVSLDTVRGLVGTALHNPPVLVDQDRSQ